MITALKLWVLFDTAASRCCLRGRRTMDAPDQLLLLSLAITASIWIAALAAAMGGHSFALRCQLAGTQPARSNHGVRYRVPQRRIRSAYDPTQRGIVRRGYEMQRKLLVDTQPRVGKAMG